MLKEMAPFIAMAILAVILSLGAYATGQRDICLETSMHEYFIPSCEDTYIKYGHPKYRSK